LNLRHRIFNVSFFRPKMSGRKSLFLALASLWHLAMATDANVPAMLEKRATSWPSKVFAPYCDVLLWPTYDAANAGAQSGAFHYTLAFITADGSGNPAWGASVGLSQNWYGDLLKKLRDAGGDVIISFGGAVGTFH
jgi:hypothetical protein